MCETWVRTYRRKFFYIQQLWNDLNNLIALHGARAGGWL